MSLNFQERTDKGCFAVFEGVDGAGKTTLIKEVERLLTMRGIPVTCVKQRPIDIYGMDATEQIAAFGKERDRLQWEEILPALDKGHAVLSDRSFFSTIVYQGQEAVLEAAELGEEKVDVIDTMGELGPDLVRPDIAFFLRTPINQCMERLYKRGENTCQDNLYLLHQRYIAAMYEFTSFIPDHTNEIARLDIYDSSDIIKACDCADMVSIYRSKKSV